MGTQFLPFSPVSLSSSSRRPRPLHISNPLVPQRWLLEQGRDDEARAVVYKLHGPISTNDPARKAAADRVFLDMQRGINAEMAVRSRALQDLWATPAMLKRTLVAVGVQVFGQFSGINGERILAPALVNETV